VRDRFIEYGLEDVTYHVSPALMTYGRDRAEAIARMRRALDVVVMEGIKTNAPLHRRIMDNPEFLAGQLDTHFMERFQPPKKKAAAS
jgi:acetyl-CoA carboxylase biotin carboxylase subunit